MPKQIETAGDRKQFAIDKPYDRPTLEEFNVDSKAEYTA